MNIEIEKRKDQHDHGKQICEIPAKHRPGEILRSSRHYLDGKEDITGYSYEPWHIRYVKDASIAKEIMDKGITLEEYLGKLPTTDVTPPKDE